jgi:hypothetical protein
MALRLGCTVGGALGLVLGVCGPVPACAEGALQPIPAAECEKFAAQAQEAIGFAMKASEDDFTDLTDGSDGRSCHIQGSAADQSVAGPIELIGKLAKVFGDWRDDPARSENAPGGAEKGLVNGNRLATLQVSWEPGPGVSCSDKQPLSACKILPQQKLWTAIVDIVVKGK